MPVSKNVKHYAQGAGGSQLSHNSTMTNSQLGGAVSSISGQNLSHDYLTDVARVTRQEKVKENTSTHTTELFDEKVGYSVHEQATVHKQDSVISEEEERHEHNTLSDSEFENKVTASGQTSSLGNEETTEPVIYKQEIKDHTIPPGEEAIRKDLSVPFNVSELDSGLMPEETLDGGDSGN